MKNKNITLKVNNDHHNIDEKSNFKKKKLNIRTNLPDLRFELRHEG